MGKYGYHGINSWSKEAQEEWRREYPRRRTIINESRINNPVAGFIYIIRCGDFSYYKIGKTTMRPEARLEALQTGVPFRLTIEFMKEVEDINEAEGHFHNKFKDKRIYREWFELNKEDIDCVKGQQLLCEVHQRA